MTLFQLTTPSYRSDHEFVRRNPVELIAEYNVPGIICDACGVWASYARLRIARKSHLEEFEGLRYLPAPEWHRSRRRWAQLLKIDPDDLSPGAILGTPTGRCKSAIREDVVHPFPYPGVIWVNDRVRTAFAKARLTGLSMMKVDLSPSRCRKDLWELVAHGRVSRKGATKKRSSVCQICGRPKFGTPKNLVINARSWDGSDFSVLDENDNIMVVSERVATLIAKNEFTNIVAKRLRSR